VSPAALARLAIVLRFGCVERAYLFELARKRYAGQDQGETERVPAVLSAYVEAITAPAYVPDRNWTMRCWNMPPEKLFASWLDQLGKRGLLRFIFLRSAARSLNWRSGKRAPRVGAEFRAACSTRLDELALREMMASLRPQSPSLPAFGTGIVSLPAMGGRTFNDPTEGFLRIEQVTFDLTGRPGLKLTILVQGTADTAPRVS
jgi:hypothetical protein